MMRLWLPSVASLRNTQAAASWKVKLWQWLLQVLKSRAGDAEEAGRSRMAVAAATKIHAMEGTQVVHMMRFHTPEPVEEVWRFSLDFTFSAVGTEACQYFPMGSSTFQFLVSFLFTRPILDLAEQPKPSLKQHMYNFLGLPKAVDVDVDEVLHDGLL